MAGDADDGAEQVIYRFEDFAALQSILTTSVSNLKTLAEGFAGGPGAGGLQLGLQGVSQELTRLLMAIQTLPCGYERRASRRT